MAALYVGLGIAMMTGISAMLQIGTNVNQFTITPTTTQAYAGNFSLTFTAQDPNGNTATSSASAFSLQWFQQFFLKEICYDFNCFSSGKFTCRKLPRICLKWHLQFPNGICDDFSGFSENR